jgi:hypothetical protein
MMPATKSSPCVSVDFWGELDTDVLRCLSERPGPTTPAQIGGQLGMSEAALSSILGMLAEAGKVRIVAVEAVIGPSSTVASTEGRVP